MVRNSHNNDELDLPLPPVDEEIDELVRRLKKIEGQARGLQRMLVERRDCEEVVIQLAAMRAALNKVGMSIVGRYMQNCLKAELAGDKDARKALDRAVDILLKLS